VCPHQSRAPAATRTQRSDEPFGSKQPIGPIALVLTFCTGATVSTVLSSILHAGSLTAHLRSLIPPFSNISRVRWISNQPDRSQGSKVKSLQSPTKVTRLRILPRNPASDQRTFFFLPSSFPSEVLLFRTYCALPQAHSCPPPTKTTTNTSTQPPPRDGRIHARRDVSKTAPFRPEKETILP
jgi:hypothetical protein